MTVLEAGDEDETSRASTEDFTVGNYAKQIDPEEIDDELSK